MKYTDLIERIRVLVQQERRIGVEVLEALFEIEKCKAYSDLGYDGLFSFCVKELRYSEAQAYRRIQAMRALKQVPELKTQIQTGRMTVTTVSQVQTYLNEERKKGIQRTQDEVAATFDQFANQSSKEVEAGIQKLLGEAAVPKLVVPMTPELQARWAEAKNLSAHQTRGQDAELLLLILNEWLQRNDPCRQKAKSTRGPASDSPASQRTRSFLTKQHPVQTQGAKTRAPQTQRPVVTPARCWIPAELRRAVWNRDQGRCQKCQTRYALQLDHIRPIAKGGESTLDNLRLLCRSCNLAHGIHEFGLAAMKRGA